MEFNPADYPRSIADWIRRYRLDITPETWRDFGIEHAPATQAAVMKRLVAAHYYPALVAQTNTEN